MKPLVDLFSLSEACLLASTCLRGRESGGEEGSKSVTPRADSGLSSDRSGSGVTGHFTENNIPYAAHGVVEVSLEAQVSNPFPHSRNHNWGALAHALKGNK